MLNTIMGNENEHFASVSILSLYFIQSIKNQKHIRIT